MMRDHCDEEVAPEELTVIDPPAGNASLSAFGASESCSVEPSRSYRVSIGETVLSLKG